MKKLLPLLLLPLVGAIVGLVALFSTPDHRPDAMTASIASVKVQYPKAIRLHVDPIAQHHDQIDRRAKVVPDSVTVLINTEAGKLLLNALNTEAMYIIYGVEGKTLAGVVDQMEQQNFSYLATRNGTSIERITGDPAEREADTKIFPLSDKDFEVINVSELPAELIQEMENTKKELVAIDQKRKEMSGKEREFYTLLQDHNVLTNAGRESDTPVVYEKEINVYTDAERKQKNTIPEVVLAGSVTEQAQRIKIYALDQDMQVMDNYQLQSFEAGDRDWLYNIKPRFDNIRAGQNTYLILAELDDGSIMGTYAQIRGAAEHIDAQIPKAQGFCLADVCNLAGELQYASGNTWIQKQEIKKDEQGEYLHEADKTIYIYDDTQKRIRQDNTYLMGGSLTVATQKGNHIIVNESRGGCGGSHTAQTVYDAQTEKELTREQLPNELPRFYHLGNVVYADPVISFAYNDHASRFPSVAYDQVSIAKIIQDIRHGIDSKQGESVAEKILPPFILVDAGEGILVQYHLQNQERGTDSYSYKGYLDEPAYTLIPNHGKMISGIQPITSLNQTQNLLTKLQKYAPQRLFDAQGNSIQAEDVQANRLPLLAVYSLNDQYDIVLPTRNHAFQMVAEMCKPAIYVYDEQERPNTVSIDLIDGGHFTTLIPDFNQPDYTRSFTTQVDGAVLVDGKQFPYLYYAAQVPDYDFNTRGHVIQGFYVQDFFSQALPTLGFNATEQADFLAYRLPKFAANKTYFISFADATKLSTKASIDRKHTPKKFTRIIMEAKQIAPTSICSTTQQHYYPGMPLAFDLATQRAAPGELDAFERGGILLTDDEQHVTIY